MKPLNLSQTTANSKRNLNKSPPILYQKSLKVDSSPKAPFEQKRTSLYSVKVQSQSNNGSSKILGSGSIERVKASCKGSYLSKRSVSPVDQIEYQNMQENFPPYFLNQGGQISPFFNSNGMKVSQQCQNNGSSTFCHPNIQIALDQFNKNYSQSLNSQSAASSKSCSKLIQNSTNISQGIDANYIDDRQPFLSLQSQQQELNRNENCQHPVSIPQSFLNGISMKSSNSQSPKYCKHHPLIQARYFEIEGGAMFYLCQSCATSIEEKGKFCFEINPTIQNGQPNLNPLKRSSYINYNESCSTPQKMPSLNNLIPKANKSSSQSFLQQNNKSTNLDSQISSSQLPTQSHPNSNNNNNNNEGRIFQKLQEIHSSNLTEEQLQVKECLLILINKAKEAENNSKCRIQNLIGKKKELEEHYFKEGQKLANYVQNLANILTKVTQKCAENMQILKNEGESIILEESVFFSGQLREIESIRGDIADNIHNIFTNLNYKPFKVIFDKYSNKIDGYNKKAIGLESTSNQLFLVNEPGIQSILSSFEQQIKEAFQLNSSISDLNLNLMQDHNQQQLQLQEQSNTSNEQDLVITNPRFGGGGHHSNTHSSKSSTSVQLISDTQKPINNSMFEDTPKDSLVEVQGIPVNSSSSDFRKAGRDNQIYVSFNNKSIFQNDCKQRIETLADDSESFSPIPEAIVQVDSTQSNLSSQDTKDLENKQDYRQTLQDTRETIQSSDKVFSVSRQSGKQASTMGSSKESQDQTYFIHSNHFKSKDDESCWSLKPTDNTQNTISRGLIGSQSSVGSQNRRDGCKSPNSQKYLQLIDKINTSQLNNNIFYQAIIKPDNQTGKEIQANSTDIINSDTNQLIISNIKPADLIPINQTTFATQLQKIQNSTKINSSISSSQIEFQQTSMKNSITQPFSETQNEEQSQNGLSSSPYYTNQVNVLQSKNYQSNMANPNLNYQKKLF